MFAQPLIDGMDFARIGRELHGEIPVKSLSRLGDMLAKSDGSLTYVVRGFREGDRYMLEVALGGMCYLRCHRCLGEIEYPVGITTRLQLVSAEQLDEVDANDDEMECIEASSQIDVLALVEDELILGLPFAPKHPEGTCSPDIEGLQQSVNAFSVLANLKKKH
ncbi:MAG: YceD family protein [Sideroxydans sp.]|nr:YceD family protein [Sideroxydans sp.]